MSQTTLKTAKIEQAATNLEAGHQTVAERERTAATMRELAAERDAMQRALKTMCSYANWQIKEGPGHTTLPCPPP